MKPSSENDESKVRRYTENLKSGNDPKRALKRLFELDVAHSVYRDAETRKHLRPYIEDKVIGKYAVRLRHKLRQLDKENSDTKNPSTSSVKVKVKPEPVSSGELFTQALSGISKTIKTEPPSVDYTKFKVKKKREDVICKPEPIDTSYESIACQSTMKQIKREPESHDDEPMQLLTKPKLSVVSQPAPHQNQPPPSMMADESMFKPRKERQKVFAGRKRKLTNEVPPLLKLCQDVITANLNLIGNVGWTPYHLLKPSLTQCGLDQLKRILDMNPILAEDADEIFYESVQREFPKYSERKKDDCSTWREVYDLLVTRKDKKDKDKLERLTNRIAAKVNSHSTRTAVVIDAAHANVRKRSCFVTARTPTTQMLHTPSAVELSRARKNVPTQGRSQLNSLQGPIRSAIQVAAPSSSCNKKNVAPLMAKVKKMMKR